MKDTIGQPCFRSDPGVPSHNRKLVGDADTDLFLATRFYSLLEPEEAERQSSLKGVTVLPRVMVPEKSSTGPVSRVSLASFRGHDPRIGQV